jgi:hypothetical protein
MSLNHKVSSPRAPSVVSQVGAGERLVSADGLRWAISRNRKMSTGGGRFAIVTSWVLKHRVDGKAVTVHGDAYEEAALAWVQA